MGQRLRVATADARKGLRGLVAHVQNGSGRVRLTRYGKTIAGIVSVKDLDALEDCEQERASRRPAKVRKP